MFCHLLKKLIIIFIVSLLHCFIASLLLPSPIHAQEVDVKNCLTPNNSVVEAALTSGEYFTIHKGVNQGEYILCKNKDCSSYEKRFVLSYGIGLQGENYWEGTDTTFRYIRADGSLAPWLPLSMRVGETWSSGPFIVQGYLIDDGRLIPYNAAHGGPTAGTQVKLESYGTYTFSTGLSLNGVAVFRVVSGPGAGEVFYCIPGVGQIGWGQNQPTALNNLTPEQMQRIVAGQLVPEEVTPVVPGQPVTAPAGTCVAGTGRPAAGDLRPQPCGDCQTKVSKPVDSCMDTAIIKTEGKFKLNTLKLCDEGRYGVWDWNAQFSLNTEKTLVPFAGYREILPAFENQQKYLADYFEGVALYDGKTPKPGEEQNFVMRSGVWRKLAPQAVQDDYKIKMIRRGYDYPLKDGQGQSLTMRAYGQSFYPAGNLPPERDKPDYLSLRADWEKTPYGLLWPFVPMFSREDTPGKITAEIENPPGELQKTTPEAQQASATKVEFPVTFPHIKRLYEVTQALQKLLLPAQTGSPSAQAAAPANQISQIRQISQIGNATGQVLAASTGGDTGCFGIRIALENKGGVFAVHAWDSNPASCGSTLVDPTIRVTWTRNGVVVGGCTLTASPGFRGFPRDDGQSWGTPITDLMGCQAPISPADLGTGDRLEVNLTVINAGGANDPDRGCFQTASCACTLKLTSEGPVQNCAGGQQVIVTEEETCPGQNGFSPDTCLKNAISDPNPKLDPACCSDTAKVVVNDYWHYIMSNKDWCEEVQDKCCNDDDPEARQSCKNHICQEPERYGSCPWETSRMYRKVRFDVKVPYLEKIWDQIGNVAGGIFTVFKPAAFPHYAEKYARSEINYDLTSDTKVKGKTPDYGPETAPAEISPQKADFYFPYLGGAELTKQWFVNALLPRSLQDLSVANPFGAPLAVNAGNETPPAASPSPGPSASCPTLTYTIDLGDTATKDLLNSRKNAILSYVDASWPSNQLEENWDKLLNAAVSKSFNPAFLMTLYIEESGAGGTGANDAFGCLPGEKKTFDESLTCFFEKSVAYKQYKNDFVKFMLVYSSLTDLERGCFSTNPRFPANIKSVFERVTGETL